MILRDARSKLTSTLWHYNDDLHAIFELKFQSPILRLIVACLVLVLAGTKCSKK